MGNETRNQLKQIIMAIEGIRINRATRDVILRDNYPHITGAPIPGFEFGGAGAEEWLIVVRHNYVGNYDQRYYKIVISEDEVADRIEHPSYPGVGQWVIRQALVKRDTSEILDNLENAENLANESVYPPNKQLKMMVIALNAVRKLSQSINLQPYEVNVLQYWASMANKIVQNYLTKKNKEANIEFEPDMDSDWITTEEPEV